MIARMKHIKTCRSFSLRIGPLLIAAAVVIVLIASLVEFAHWLALP